MQRALSFDDGPTLSIPLRFFLTGPLFALAAAVLLLWQGPPAFVSRWSMPALALTHLMTLGFLAMIMCGALLQILPVVAGVNIVAPKYTGALVFGGLTCGTVLLTAAFLSFAPILFRLAGLSLAFAFLCLLGAVYPGLRGCSAGVAAATVNTIRLALVSLLITVCLGTAMVASFGWTLSWPVMEITSFHAAWGLLGWVALLIIGVAFQVIPMFQATPAYPHAAAFPLASLLAAWLGAWSAAAFLPGESMRTLQSVLALALLCTLLGFALVTLSLLQRRRRPAPEATTHFWRLSMASLVACCIVYLVSADAEPLLLGVLFIVGCAFSAVNGMLYKIVPFLLWYDLQNKSGLDRKSVPSIRELILDRAAKQQFWLHLAALVLLAGATIAPVELARPAAALFGLSCMRLWWNLARACLVHRGAASNKQQAHAKA
jgi:hypothetical protein